MEAIYTKFMGGVVRSEYRTVNAVSDLNFNTPNNYTVFRLDHGDAFYDSRIMFHIQGEVVKKSDGSAYPKNSTIKLVNNFPAFLFSRIELKKHNTIIDSVDNPGLTGYIKGMLMYTNTTTLSNCGFVSQYSGGGKFEALGTLGHLGLGFFDHLQYPMYKGGFEITFTRSEDNDALYHWKGSEATDVEPEDGKVKITSFVLRVPLVEYSSTSRIQLIAGLKELSDKDRLSFRYYQWQCIEKKGVFGSSFNFDITNAYRSVNDPRFVIIGLQTNRSNDQKANPSVFDSCTIKNVTVKINGDRYPQELQNLNMADSKWRLLYDQYVRFRMVNFGDSDVMLNPENFQSNFPIMVIDTHLHPQSTDRSRSDIQVELDFINPVAPPAANSGTTAYVVVVAETNFKYDITRNTITFR